MVERYFPVMLIEFQPYKVTETSIVFMIRGLIDGNSFAQIRPAIDKIIRQHPRYNYLLDVTEVEDISRHGVDAIIELHDEIALLGGRLAIAKANQDVYKKLYLSGADLFISIYDSYQEALADNQNDHGTMPLIHPEELFRARPIDPEDSPQ